MSFSNNETIIHNEYLRHDGSIYKLEFALVTFPPNKRYQEDHRVKISIVKSDAQTHKRQAFTYAFIETLDCLTVFDLLYRNTLTKRTIFGGTEEETGVYSRIIDISKQPDESLKIEIRKLNGNKAADGSYKPQKGATVIERLQFTLRDTQEELSLQRSIVKLKLFLEHTYLLGRRKP